MLKQDIISSNKKIFILFFCAFVFRLLVSFLYDIQQVYTDAIMYHNYGVNIAKGNGYSDRVTPPFDVNFIREPGNTYVIGFAYKIAASLGVEPTYIDPLEKEPEFRISKYHPEIYFARALFSLIEAISILFLFLTFRYVLNIKHAFRISFLMAIFYPSAFFVVTLLRESLLTSVFIILNYFFVSYFFRKRITDLILSGILLGISILIFQASALLGLFMGIFILVKDRTNIKRVLLSTAIIAFFSILVITPWVNKAYNSYPDIRVAKTFGTSLTMEMSKCMGSAVLIRDLGGMNDQQLGSFLTSLYQIPSSKQFQYSIDGTFKAKNDSLNRILSTLPNNSLKAKASICAKNYLVAFKYFLCPNYWSGIVNKQSISQSKFPTTLLLVAPYLFLFVAVLIGVFGCFFFFRQLAILSIIQIFLFFLILYNPFLGSEGRRMLPMFYLWIPAAYILVVHYVCNDRHLFIKSDK